MVVRSSETSPDFYQTIWHYIREDSIVNSHRCQYVKSNKFIYVWTSLDLRFHSCDGVHVILWFVTSCNHVDGYQYFGGTCYTMPKTSLSMRNNQILTQIIPSPLGSYEIQFSTYDVAIRLYTEGTTDFPTQRLEHLHRSVWSLPVDNTMMISGKLPLIFL
jgi:hypothetical protein